MSIWSVVDVFGRVCSFAHALQFIDKAGPIRARRREASHVRKEQRFKLIGLDMRDEAVRPSFTHFGDGCAEYSLDRSAAPNRIAWKCKHDTAISYTAAPTRVA